MIDPRTAVLVAVVLAGAPAAGGQTTMPAPVDVSMPDAGGRPPAVLVVAGADAAISLAEALRSEGLAVKQHPVPDRAGLFVDFEAQVQAILTDLVAIRNDARFPTVTVLGQGGAAMAAAIAARAGRADGFVSVAPERAAPDITLLKVPVIEWAAGESGARAVANAVRDVRPLGRRGTREPRPSDPRRSPRQAVMTLVGDVRVAIEYGSPQMRGRDVWGALVPWDRVWMPGADEATTLTTSGPLQIGTLDVPAGDHTIYLMPRTDQVTLIISRDVGQFHTVHDASLERGRVDMTSGRTPGAAREGLTFLIDVAEPGSSLRLAWADRVYSVAIRPGR